ncbi:MAG: septal ring lytic transglycosylase RlpA family protein [Azonexaceae bacterium]|nr:septal ring lytic transglycosylase RlpA family protein [Azonexaceae bacterium]
MTKRRPLWSKWQLRVAAIVCGLFLLNASSPVWAASKKPSHKVVHKAAASRHTKKLVRHAPRHAELNPEFGPADLVEDGVPGLHGHASFYGKGFHGRKTATGERFDVQQFTAASNRFPLGTMLAVRRVDIDRCAIVKVNDRMHPKHHKRIIDVSRSVAEYLNMIRAGVVFVSVAPLKKGRQDADVASCRAAFEPDPDAECASCAQLPKLPDFLPSIDG